MMKAAASRSMTSFVVACVALLLLTGSARPVEAVMCDTFNCSPTGVTTYHPKANQGSIACSTTCDFPTCCDLNESCLASMCPTDSHTPRAGPITCATTLCTIQQCCIAHQICGAWTCTTPQYYRDANKADLTPCPSLNCVDTDCCLAYPNCGGWTCSTGWPRKPNPTTRYCPAPTLGNSGGCSDEICCEPRKFCSEHNCPGPALVHTWNADSTICPLTNNAYACTDGLCCIAAADCSWHSCTTPLVDDPQPPQYCSRFACTDFECCTGSRCSQYECDAQVGLWDRADKGRIMCTGQHCAELQCCDDLATLLLYNLTRLNETSADAAGGGIGAFLGAYVGYILAFNGLLVVAFGAYILIKYFHHKSQNATANLSMKQKAASFGGGTMGGLGLRPGGYDTGGLDRTMGGGMGMGGGGMMNSGRQSSMMGGGGSMGGAGGYRGSQAGAGSFMGASPGGSMQGGSMMSSGGGAPAIPMFGRPQGMY